MQYNYEKQNKKGKLHAIERINLLLDKDSFVEIGQHITHSCTDFGMNEKITPYDGVITGFGLIDGRQVGIYSQDFTVMGGSLGKAHGEKIANLISRCIETRCPVVGINDSGGARIQEGIHSLAGYADIFYQNTRASGYIPQISIIAGPCAGGAVYSPGITDFVFVIEDISKMFITGPKVVKAVMNENVTAEELGGAAMHSTKSGVAHFYAKSEQKCMQQVKQLLSSIPHCCDENIYKKVDKKIGKRKCNLDNLLPNDSSKSYDVCKVIDEICDKNTFIQVHESYAQNAVVGFGKLVGLTVGIVANQPSFMGGVLDCDASDKIARFVRYCDSYDIPIITLVDVPGYLPGTREEQKGIIRHGAKVLYAYSEATTAKITLILRKAYGGAYIAMCCKGLGADYVMAWDTAEIAVMGAKGAVEILYGRQMADTNNPQELLELKINEYNEKFINPDTALKYGYVDSKVEKSQTRNCMFQYIWSLRNKKSLNFPPKKHGNIPL